MSLKSSTALRVSQMPWAKSLGTFKKVTILMTEVILIQLLSYRTVGSKQKNEKTEYLDIFISLSSQLYSKQGVSIFPIFFSHLV